MFSIFKRKDPICGMKEERGSGIIEEGKWFCSKVCLEKYRSQTKNRKHEDHSCCSMKH